jgi:diguanylate cyclase (GGDEF)-like protein
MWRPIAWVLASLTGLVLLLSACAAVLAINTQRDRFITERLGGAANGFGSGLAARLDTADAWVRYLSSSSAGSEAELRQRVLSSDAFRGLLLEPWDGVRGETARQDTAHEHGLDGSERSLPALLAADRVALSAGQTVLKAGLGRGEADIYLVHLVRAANSREIAFFELTPEWLWRIEDRLADHVTRAVMASGQLIYDASELPLDQLRALSRVGVDPHHLRAPVLQRWLQSGEPWVGAVVRIDFPATRLVTEPWTVIACTRVGEFDLALASFTPALLGLLLLGAMGVGCGTVLLARRWQPALEALRAALTRLGEGSAERVEESLAADAVHGVARAYNEALAQLEQRREGLEGLMEIDRLLLQAEELEQSLESILLRVRMGTGAVGAEVALLDRDAPHYARAFTIAADSSHCPVSRLLLDDEAMLLLREQPQGLTVAAHRAAFLEALRALGAGHCQVWPIFVNEELTAILAVGYRADAPPRARQLQFGAECAARLRMALTKRTREERLYRQAHFDSLTTLPNRVLFRDRLSQEITNAAQSGQRGALLYVDLDHFKQVNDTVGHLAGDQLLLIVAQRLRATVKDGDTVARLGGDEFTVILRNLPSAESAGEIAQRIIDGLQRPVNIGGRDHQMRASIGVALFPDDGNSIEELMRNADLAMYQAKDAGRSRAVFFDSKLARAKLPVAESGLFRALRRGEFVLHYQPQFALAGGSLTGLEALLRWSNPREGMRFPNDFVPLAEQSGLIVDIGSWVIESVCQQFARWRDDGIAPPRVGINISAQQLRSADFSRMLRQMLERFALQPQTIELEITEDVLAEEAARQSLRAVSALGVRLALDDFGTGHSSLYYLRRHAVDTIKIDRSFMQEVPDDAQATTLTATIIDMAHALGKQVIAEGVETLRQLEFLREHACDEAQGFALARPLSVADATELLTGRRTSELLLAHAV